MADALTSLNAMIEQVRAEADAAGYERAWAEIAQLAAERGAPPVGVRLKVDWNATPPKARAITTESGARAPRGENRRRVTAVLSDATSPKTPQAIRREIEKRENLDLAYSSVQQALVQLEAAGEARKDDNGRWMLTGAPGGDPSFYDSEPDEVG